MLKMYRIEKPEGWINRSTRVVCHGEKASYREGKIVAYGENRDGDKFYLVDVGVTSLWKRPTEIEIA